MTGWKRIFLVLSVVWVTAVSFLFVSTNRIPPPSKDQLQRQWAMELLFARHQTESKALKAYQNAAAVGDDALDIIGDVNDSMERSTDFAFKGGVYQANQNHQDRLAVRKYMWPLFTLVLVGPFIIGLVIVWIRRGFTTERPK